jgi:hypothetical protein
MRIAAIHASVGQLFHNDDARDVYVRDFTRDSRTGAVHHLHVRMASHCTTMMYFAISFD